MHIALKIVYAERPLTDNHRSLASYGLKDGDVVILRQKENVEPRPPGNFPGLPRIDFSSIAVPGMSTQQPQQPAQHLRSSPPEAPSFPQGLDNPALLRDMLLANPHELSLLKERNPPLAEALLSGDLEKFTKVLVEQQQDRARREQERIRLFSADPFDLEAQAKIEEDIRQQNIEENMTIAMEEAPESFGQVVMLYINCKVNGHPVKAFVDSGAQMTIMSQACAERCNIMRLVDRRWAGIAKGVGTQKIIGRVHLAQVQIEGDFLPCSFSILEEQPMDMLLGLDMLKRHQCSIDLKKNVLVIGTTGSQTPFLPEGELPECARLAYGAGREDMRPEEIADQELAEALQKSVEEAAASRWYQENQVIEPGRREREFSSATENSDKETTSLEMPSLPTSDGLKNPVHSSGLRSKICNPTNQLLDRSVSAPASVGSHKSSLAEKIDPGAVKSLKSSAECQITPEKDHSHLLQSLADHASSADNDQQTGEAACHGPNISSQNTLEKMVAADSLKENTKARGHDLDSPLEVTREDMPDANMCAQQTVPELPLPSEQLELNQMNELPVHLQRYEPVNERHLEKQSEPTDPEYPCNIGGLELPAVGEQGLTNIQPESLANSLAEKRGHGLEKVGLSREKENAQMSASCSCTLTETFMEIDVVEQSTIEVHGLSREHSAQTKNISASGLNIDCPLMEMESSKQESSLSEPLSNPFSTSELLSPESNVEMTGTCNELSNSVAEKSSSSSGICQLHTDPAASAEEPSLSLASALKELHELLIINCKGDSKILAPEEDVCQLAKVPEEQVQCEELSKDEHGNVGPDGQDLNSSFHQERFEQMNSEGPAEEPPCPDETENMSVQFFNPSQTAVERDALEIQMSPGTSDSVILSSVATSNQVHMEQAEVGPERSLKDQHATDQTLEKNKSFPPELTVDEGVPPNLFPGTPGVTDSSTSTEDLRPPHQIIEPPPRPPVSYPELSSIVPPPSLFPAADINQILCAGFTLQEALEALERAGGNADLALLSLLAKNIRVPA
ncbi:regulatory solute carrier protein family 1 member 1 isoform X1 [Alligator sinensis]|uniref:Regulatory solute carrier protein family 1 member 1 isoform X1 n=3 Tax=Alligator sinensis TaxID=38654 RepID=A0A3Q0GIC4_ALLSI|nr:regulatory solute carrier protein family 1 member 1 isoform X1 [Alligator sinensis]